MRDLLVSINAKEKTCGKCAWKAEDSFTDLVFCLLFRKQLEKAPYKGGNVSYKRCPKCLFSEA